MPELFIERPDFSDDPGFAGDDVRCRPGVERADRNDSRFKRINAPADEMLEITDKLGTGDERILCPVRRLGMTALTVNDDLKFIDGT